MLEATNRWLLGLLLVELLTEFYDAIRSPVNPGIERPQMIQKKPVA
jgi:hypothetical protein